jgi:hypothetical protein
MTTYQEPLQSRRAARQGERAEAPPGTLTDPNAVPAPPASSSAPAASSAEPLNYATTSRPPLPQYDGQSLRPRRTAEAPGHADLPPTESLPRQDVPSFRPKDYSPEGRRSAVPSWAPSYDGTVDFQTQNRDQVMAPPAGPAVAPVSAPQAPAAEGEHTMTRRELRALREAEGITAVPTSQTPVVAAFVAPPVAPVIEPYDAAPAAPIAPAPPAPVAPAPVESALIEVPIPLVPPAPQPSTRLDSALAEFDALAAGREPIAPAPDAAPPLPGRRAAQQPAAPVAEAPDEQPSGLAAFEALFAPPPSVQPVQEPPAPPASAQVLAPPIVEPAPAPEAFAPAPTPAPEVVQAIDPLLFAPAPQGAPALVPPPANPHSASAGPASGPSSVGHWSTQSDIDDAEQVVETTISRSVGVGNGAITTSALVLPSVPEHTIGGPMSGNGEILLTGSISLPHSFSATGAHPSQLDESDLDHLLDPGDHQVTNTDSTPVRAIRAVSTHTATGAIIAPSKVKGTRGFTILIVAASVMAVVVVGLLVAGLVSGTL